MMYDVLVRRLRDEGRRNGGQGAYAWRARALCTKAADAIERLQAELAEVNGKIVVFGGPWAASWAREHGYPDGHLHPTHYDILENAGARMDSFTRAAIRERT